MPFWSGTAKQKRQRDVLGVARLGSSSLANLAVGAGVLGSGQGHAGIEGGLVPVKGGKLVQNKKDDDVTRRGSRWGQQRHHRGGNQHRCRRQRQPFRGPAWAGSLRWTSRGQLVCDAFLFFCTRFIGLLSCFFWGGGGRGVQRKSTRNGTLTRTLFQGEGKKRALSKNKNRAARSDWCHVCSPLIGWRTRHFPFSRCCGHARPLPPRK